jgi:hypothetical protein
LDKKLQLSLLNKNTTFTAANFGGGENKKIYRFPELNLRTRLNKVSLDQLSKGNNNWKRLLLKREI